MIKQLTEEELQRLTELKTAMVEQVTAIQNNYYAARADLLGIPATATEPFISNGVLYTDSDLVAYHAWAQREADRSTPPRVIKTLPTPTTPPEGMVMRDAG